MKVQWLAQVEDVGVMSSAAYPRRNVEHASSVAFYTVIQRDGINPIMPAISTP